MNDIEWNELYWDEQVMYYVEDGETYEDYTWGRYMDKSPKVDEEVFIELENGDIKTAIYDGWDFGEYDRDDVEAWAEIPEEFKE